MIIVARKELYQISTIIGHYLGDDKKEEFLAACDNLDEKSLDKSVTIDLDNLDYNVLNDLLDKTVEVLTGFSNIHFAMSSFIDKFPTLKDKMEKELTQYHSEHEKTLVFDKYYHQLKDAIMKDKVKK
jgi:hypothetical protein